MVKKTFTFIILIFIYFNSFSQKSDTLFIEFSKGKIDKTVFINKMDVYGDTIDSPKKNNLVFLFTNEELLDKLDYKKEQKKKYPNRIYGYSSGPPQYGIELDNYQLDSLGFQSYIKNLSNYKRIENNLKKFDIKNELKKEDLERFDNQMFETLIIPLKDFYVNQQYLNDKKIFTYTGTKTNYEEFQKILKKFRYTFIIIPYDFSEIYSYKYHLKQVKKRYILPGL